MDEAVETVLVSETRVELTDVVWVALVVLWVGLDVKEVSVPVSVSLLVVGVAVELAVRLESVVADVENAVLIVTLIRVMEDVSVVNAVEVAELDVVVALIAAALDVAELVVDVVPLGEALVDVSVVEELSVRPVGVVTDIEDVIECG